MLPKSSSQVNIAKSYQAQELENWKRSSELCKEVLKRLFKELVQSASDGSVNTTEELESRWQKFLRAYDQEGKGPAKHAEFFKGADQLLEAARKVSQLEVAAAEDKAFKKATEEKEKMKKEYERLEKLYATVELEWKKTEEEGKQLKQENKGLIMDMAKMEKRVKVVDELEKENAELKKRVAELEPKLVAAEKKAAAITVVEELVFLPLLLLIPSVTNPSPFLFSSGQRRMTRRRRRITAVVASCEDLCVGKYTVFCQIKAITIAQKSDLNQPLKPRS